MHKLLLILFILLCFAESAFGATYYCRYDSGTLYYKLGAWPTAADNDGNSTDLDDLFDDLDGSGHTVVLASDTYSGTELDADDGIDTVDGNITIRGPISIDPQYEIYGGTVTIDGSEVDDRTINIIDTDVTIENITFIGHNENHNVYVARDSVLNDLTITGGTAGVALWNSSATLNRLHVSNSIDKPVSITGDQTTDTPTFNYCLFENSIRGAVIAIGDTITFNNCLFTGFTAEAVKIITNPVTVDFNNCIFAANNTGSYHTIDNLGGGTVTTTNCLLLPAAFAGDTYNWNNVTDGGNNIYVNPQFIGTKKQGRVMFIIDDYGNLEHVKQLSAIAAPMGIPMVWGLSTEPTNGIGGVITITSETWDSIAEFITMFDGNEVAAHGKRHSRVDDLEGGYVSYTGDASTATMTISVAGETITTTLAGDQTDGSENLSIDINNVSYDTLYEVVNYIEGQTGYSATQHDLNDSGDPLTLADITNQDIKTDTNGATPENYTMLFDSARYFANEITAPKTKIETELSARLGSYSCDTFIYPGNAQNETAQDAVKAAGYLGARSGAAGDRDIEDLQIFASASINVDNIFGKTNETRNIAPFIEAVNYWGYGYGLFCHDADEYPVADWQNIITACKNSNVIISNLRDYYTFIRTGTDADEDGERWTRTIPDNSNYRFKPESPCINAGMDVSLTQDFEKQRVPHSLIPEIGLYEYWPNAIFGPFMEYKNRPYTPGWAGEIIGN